jgi:hypothetical protein
MRSGLWKDKSPSWPSAPYLRERKSDVGLTICQEGNFQCLITVIITSNYFFLVLDVPFNIDSDLLMQSVIRLMRTKRAEEIGGMNF